MIEKLRNFPLPSPHFVIVDWRKSDTKNSNGLEFEPCLVYFNGIKVETEWI